MTKSGILGHPLHGPPKDLGGFRSFADILQEVVICPERYVKASASWALQLGVFTHGIDNAPGRLVHILGHEADDVQIEGALQQQSGGRIVADFAMPSLVENAGSKCETKKPA